MTHTPSPWEVSKHGTPEAHPQFGVYAQDRRNDHVIVKGDSAVADATLIAAAPELLAALDDLLHQVERRKNGVTFARDAARAAIAKAKGDA